MIKINSLSTDETQSAGMLLARAIEKLKSKASFTAIYGDLGAGKTVFVRGFVSVLSPLSRVKSPTYTIVNEYLTGKIPVFHFDLYRLNDAYELDGIGFDEYIVRGHCIAEWAERLSGYDIQDMISVRIEKTDDNSRLITIDGIDAMEVN